MNGQYHVYVPLSDDKEPMGICHGAYTNGSFWGHIYFMEEFRGMAFEGFRSAIELADRDLKIDFFITKILDDNLKAKMFARVMGFTKENDNYILDWRI